MRRLRVRWRAAALADLQRHHDWLSTIDGAQPNRVIGRIRAAANSMRRLGDIGRPGIADARELSVRKSPYVIVYVVADGAAEIVAVYHTAQQR